MRNSKTYFFFFFWELGLTKGVSTKTCVIGAGAALENLPYELSNYLSVLEHLVKYLKLLIQEIREILDDSLNREVWEEE